MKKKKCFGMMKKGQFYILMAVMLCAVIFAVAYPLARLSKPKLETSKLTENFMTEAKYVVDSSVMNGDDVDIQMQDFAIGFLEFAREKEPDTNLVYLLSVPDLVVLHNYGAGKYELYTDDGDISTDRVFWGILAPEGPDSHKIIKRDKIVILTRKGAEYEFVLPLEDYKVQALFVSG